MKVGERCSGRTKLILDVALWPPLMKHVDFPGSMFSHPGTFFCLREEWAGIVSHDGAARLGCVDSALAPSTSRAFGHARTSTVQNPSPRTLPTSPQWRACSPAWGGASSFKFTTRARKLKAPEAIFSGTPTPKKLLQDPP